MAAKFQEFFNNYIWDTRKDAPANELPEERDAGKIYSFQTPAPQPPIWTLEQILGSPSGGHAVSSETALTISAFYRAVSIKSGVLSSIPYKLYRKTSAGREEVRPSDHPVARMFTKKVNSKMTKTVFLERAMGQYDIKGNHYAMIKRNGLGQAVELVYVPHDDVQVYETTEGLFYKIRGIENPMPASKMIHVPNFGDGVVGKNVIQKASEDMALAMNARGYGSKFFADGGRPQFVFIPKEGAKPTNPQRAELQENWKKAKLKNSEIAIPHGWDIKELSISPEQAEFLGTAQATVADISRWTGVPLYKLADMSAATRNNVEQQSIEFLQDTMAPIGSKFENEHNVKLLTLESEQDMYLEYNWDAYIRPDTITKAEAFSKYVQNAIKTPDQIRALNNDPAMGGAAGKLYMQGATVPIDLIEKVMLASATRPQARYKKKKEAPGQLIIEDLLEMINTNGNGSH